MGVEVGHHGVDGALEGEHRGARVDRRPEVTLGLAAADLRSNGVPEWLPGGIQKHSVRLSPARAKDLAAAVARYAPSVAVIDARDPGGGERVAP